MDTAARRRLRPVGTIFIFVGVIILLVASYQALQKIIVLQTWTPVQAQFVQSDVVNDKVNVTIQTARADNYRVNWTFRYQVAGTDRVAKADPGTSGRHSEMLKWLNRFHPGQQVQIRHKPDNPDLISAAAYDWITFSHAAWVAMWGVGIVILGIAMRKFSHA